MTMKSFDDFTDDDFITRSAEPAAPAKRRLLPETHNPADQARWLLQSRRCRNLVP
jgi:hypothetical protein